MNLTKLFETQKILRDRIDYNESDRFNKLILALLVELGECANEVRCFKFWSQKPPSEKAVILEEYVDGLHFVLELGIELEKDHFDWFREYQANKAPYYYLSDSLTDQFNDVFGFVTDLELTHEYSDVICYYLGLGEMLGFSWKEIEEAYFAKNQVNHERQDNGY